jgi:hypothetical protein
MTGFIIVAAGSGVTIALLLPLYCRYCCVAATVTSICGH